MKHFQCMLVLSCFLIEGLAVGTLTPAHAQRKCGLSACLSGEITVTLSNTRNGRWKKGAYHVELLNQRDETICEVRFALPKPNTFEFGRSSPGPIGSPRPKCWMRVNRDSRFPESEFIVWIDYARRQNPKSIRLSYNGSVLLEAQLNLNYRISYPNGPACSPKCRRAKSTIFVSKE